MKRSQAMDFDNNQLHTILLESSESDSDDSICTVHTNLPLDPMKIQEKDFDIAEDLKKIDKDFDHLIELDPEQEESINKLRQKTKDIIHQQESDTMKIHLPHLDNTNEDLKKQTEDNVKMKKQIQELENSNTDLLERVKKMQKEADRLEKKCEKEMKYPTPIQQRQEMNTVRFVVTPHPYHYLADYVTFTNDSDILTLLQLKKHHQWFSVTHLEKLFRNQSGIYKNIARDIAHAIGIKESTLMPQFKIKYFRCHEWAHICLLPYVIQNMSPGDTWKYQKIFSVLGKFDYESLFNDECELLEYHPYIMSMEMENEN